MKYKNYQGLCRHGQSWARNGAMAADLDPVKRSEFFILSDLRLSRGAELAATVEVCTDPKCARCWKHLPDVGTHAAHPTLCGRCVEAVG